MMLQPRRFVVDASVAVKWVVGEPDGERAATLLDDSLIAPDVLPADCAAVLAGKVAAGELSPEEAETAALALEAAEVQLVATRPYLAKAVALAGSGRPVFDCLYLAIVETFDIPLVTADRTLIAEIDRIGSEEHPAAFRGRVLDLAEVEAEKGETDPPE